MPEGLGSLGDRLRVATQSDASWQPQLSALAERLVPLNPEQRAAEWRDTMAEFIRRQEQAGVAPEQIGRTIDGMARLVADMILTIEANSADEEARRRRDADYAAAESQRNEADARK
jgi:hypothetical protein